MAVDGLDGGNGNLGVGHSHVLPCFGDDRKRPPRRDQCPADLEKVASVARQFWLHDGSVIAVGGHLGKEEHAVELGGQLELLHPAMLVDYSVLVLDFPEGEKLVILVDAELVTVVAQVLHDFRVGRLLGVGVGPL